MKYEHKPKYFAVPDPDTGDMTYWYLDRRGMVQPWPQKPRPARHYARTTRREKLSPAFVTVITGRKKFLARYLHHEFLEITSTLRLLMETDHRPIITDPDEVI
jgi:hypothetical protein